MLAADRLVLPGVGAAGAAAERLKASGLGEALEEAVRRRGRPMLGICLGMELLAERLLEFGEHVVSAGCRAKWCICAMRGVAKGRVPHMGWNLVEPSAEAARFFQGPERMRTFYFCHSFTLVTGMTSAIAARATYESHWLRRCWMAPYLQHSFILRNHR